MRTIPGGIDDASNLRTSDTPETPLVESSSQRCASLSRTDNMPCLRRTWQDNKSTIMSVDC